MASRAAYSTWTPQKPTLFDGHYLRNRSTCVGVLGYIGIVQHKEHSPEVLSIPPGTLCIQLWAHSRPKHVEKRNKHTKKNCAPSWLYLQDFTGMHGQQNVKLYRGRFVFFFHRDTSDFNSTVRNRSGEPAS